MVKDAINRLEDLCDKLPPLLLALEENEISHKPSPGKWSKKEILGHLIDSATNNHQRFVRVQFENHPSISYDQNNWNSCSYYNTLNTADLIHFWTFYNRHLAALAKNIPEKNYSRTCKVGETNMTLEFIITDYVTHLEHHLAQLVNYK